MNPITSTVLKRFVRSKFFRYCVGTAVSDPFKDMFIRANLYITN